MGLVGELGTAPAFECGVCFVLWGAMEPLTHDENEMTLLCNFEHFYFLLFFV